MIVSKDSPAEFPLTDEQRALLPDDQEIALYEQYGYYISREGVIPDELIDRAIVGSERLFRGECDWRLPTDQGYSNSPAFDEGSPRNNEFVSLQIRELRDLALYPVIGAIAARLTRAKTIRLLDDQLIWKPSRNHDEGSTVTGWHADRAYWGTCSSDNLTTAWIPLHDVAINRAPLVVMAGSHRWSGLQDMRHFNQRDLVTLEKQFNREGKEVRIVPMTLKRGQVSFHHAWTLHASYANTSGQPRLSLAVHLQDGANHYRPYCNSQGNEIHIFDEQLCRKLPSGDPDFSDPAVFPVIWSELS